MNTATLPTSQQTRSAWRRALVLMIGLSLLPITIGAWLYFTGWQPAKTSNHGTLIAPPIPVTLNGPEGRWSLVLIGDAPCDDACAARMDELRRVRVSLAKEMQRTQTLRSGAPLPLTGLPAGTVIIVDPDGRAMMRYAPDAEAKAMRADLERLLKYSWIG